MTKPIIGIPMGDPAGIGPEIIVKALKDEKIYETCNPLVIGDANIIKKAAQICNADSKMNIITSAKKGIYNKNTINIIDLNNIDVEQFEYGTVQAQNGRAAYEYIKTSVEMALSDEITSIATTPINKPALKAADVDFIGHTEILAGLTNTKDPLTMFEVRGMRVFFLTRHVSLKQACDMVSVERLLDYIDRCTEALRSLGVNEGTMAVAGLNPHSGDNGLFGTEDDEIIKPAVLAAKEQGYKVEGPVGADSVFHLALMGRYNSVLSLYHDQGHIATKTLDFERTIAITLGLPFLRTSVDHGTAYDIAGKGIASEVSMVEAILLAGKYSESYSRWVKREKK
ncbi:4-hydroxythreonine-4-phosphate dehydrogenase PdxA [Ruminiclostridium herbifermentans]|uniref:4-hydroxythreonine-4-phosphate dehydrogenase PdxA n=1 Tax=Ruminiclostridium herbifermentans TaxID=2488810 RepID=A0A4U7JEA5_9FIRM|nr:4-hydroxythreonine-4-phosphate dehydrogenase PdxA [Ruminiclostridium herbifermentans]QNU67986.1 4-hydroxythreonine-4-phosphate dehydrogenase PdxA [Ruminiclostridium herbifermentans]